MKTQWAKIQYGKEVYSGSLGQNGLWYFSNDDYSDSICLPSVSGFDVLARWES